MSEVARELATLKQTWLTLATNIEVAETLRRHTAANPALLTDPRSRALVQWLENHERDIIALKTLVDAADDAALELSLNQIQLARRAAEKLLDELQRSREDADTASRDMPHAANV